jgi:addiction module HigA family antidote
LNAATSLSDFGRLKSVGLHKLKGDLKGFWSIDINGPWRVLFRFTAGDIYEVYIHDPHRQPQRSISGFPQGVPLPPVHPGRTIAAELAARGLSADRAAIMMRVPANRLGFIIAGRRGISADTALRPARLFGTSGQFWMTMQSQYDLALAVREHGQRISAEVEAAD